MKRIFLIFMALVLVCAGAFAEGGMVELDDGSTITYNSGEDGSTDFSITNPDGTSSGSSYDSETGSYTEWGMDEEGNTYSKTTHADGSESGYTSIAGGNFTEWNTDSEGNLISNTYNTDGSSTGYYLPKSGDDYTEWNVDSQGNTSGTVYNYITGETTNYYDPKNPTPTPRPSNKNTNTNRNTNTNSNSAPAYYPAVSSATGPAYIVSNGTPVNVYSFPSADGAVVARLENGTPINVISSVSGWAEIAFGNMTGHVDARFISFTAPAVAVTPVPTVVPALVPTVQGAVRTATEQYVTMIKIQPVTVSVRVPQAGATVTLRWAPSETEPAISNLPEGYSLTALSLNTDWVQVYDPKTNDVGFIPRVFVNGL
ncbi:MAG: hypothetical protein J6B53_05925 [Clostridia bacterium]|nr:hypothetical protein [Clostridia bacterium]